MPAAGADARHHAQTIDHEHDRPVVRSVGPGALVALIAAGVAAVGVVVPAPRAAQAQTAPAMTRCMQNAAPDATQTVVHQGNQPAVTFPSESNPPNAIFPGDVVRVRIDGSVRIDFWGNSYGPEGAEGAHRDHWRRQTTSWPFPHLNPFASVARWNNNPTGWFDTPVPMPTVSLRSCQPAPAVPVRLVYLINDPGIGDNGGQWTITTEIFRANGRTCPPGQFYAEIYGCVPRPW